MKSQPGPPATLGSTAAREVRLSMADGVIGTKRL